MTAITQVEIDQQVFDLYDEYCHGRINRREFLKRAGALGAAALAMAQGLLPDYALAQTISFTDTRIKASYVTYPSPGGNGDRIRGYLVQPAGNGPWPAVLVIHENRGLNPYIEDVARRFAVANFIAFAPDGLTSVGGYPGNDEAGGAAFRTVDAPKMFEDFVASAGWLKSHPRSTGKVGAVGFCFGGGISHQLAVRLPDLAAAVPFYGRQPSADDAAKVRAPLLVHLAANDPGVNKGWPTYEAALKANNKVYTAYTYENTQHGFHNDTTPR
jgi:carboxymethylenebutenolidase